MAGRAIGRSAGARIASHVAVVATAIVVLLGGGSAALLAAVPSVAGAPVLVRLDLTGHGGTPAQSPPPPRVSASIRAIEDHLLGAPPGVDIAYGALRYLWNRVVHGLPDQGGSTIAQQLAKLVYTGPATGLGTEIEQVGLALKLEITYPTPVLTTLYLDAAYYGQGAYGLVAAARTYFGTRPSDLSWAQAAMLAGLVQAPSAYDPVVHPRLARERQLEVEHELVVTGALSPRLAAQVRREPLGLVDSRITASKAAAGRRA